MSGAIEFDIFHGCSEKNIIVFGDVWSISVLSAKIQR